LLQGAHGDGGQAVRIWWLLVLVESAMPMTAAGSPSLLRDLDYIVVNHLEPDHCASMVEVHALYPNCQIVSTKKSFMLMHSFGYDIDSHS